MLHTCASRGISSPLSRLLMQVRDSESSAVITNPAGYARHFHNGSGPQSNGHSIQNPLKYRTLPGSSIPPLMSGNEVALSRRFKDFQQQIGITHKPTQSPSKCMGLMSLCDMLGAIVNTSIFVQHVGQSIIPILKLQQTFAPHNRELCCVCQPLNRAVPESRYN